MYIYTEGKYGLAKGVGVCVCVCVCVCVFAHTHTETHTHKIQCVYRQEYQSRYQSLGTPNSGTGRRLEISDEVQLEVRLAGGRHQPELWAEVQLGV